MSVREIAKAAGVSASTVSRALRDRNAVNPKTAEKILSCSKKLGLKPRKYTLRKNGKNSAANPRRLLCLFPASQGASQDAHRLLEGITLEAKRRGAAMSINYFEGPDCNLLMENASTPDGVLIFGKGLSSSQAEVLQHLPTVWIYSGKEMPWGDRIQPDHFNIGVKCLNHFKAQGVKRVCAVGYRPQNCGKYTTQRLAGFQMAAQQHGLECRTLLGDDVDERGEVTDIQRYCRQIIDGFLNLSPRPEAMFIANYWGAYLHGMLVEHGIVPMKDILMIAGDNTVVGSYLRPMPITIDVHVDKVGAMATNLLYWRLANPDALPIRCLTHADLVLPWYGERSEVPGPIS